MTLDKRYIRDGQNLIIGSITSGFSDTSEFVRDGDNRILGSVNERFRDTRNYHGTLESVNSANSGILIRRK